MSASPFLVTIGLSKRLYFSLAMAEMRLIIARMLWNFDLVLSEEHKERDWADQKVFVVWQRGSLNVKVLARKFGQQSSAA